MLLYFTVLIVNALLAEESDTLENMERYHPSHVVVSMQRGGK